MEYSGRTALEALKKAKKYIGQELETRPDLAGGVFYVQDHGERRHCMRRFSASYIKGDYEQRVIDNCNLVDGILILK